MKQLLFLFLTIGFLSCGDDDERSVDCLPANLQGDIIAFYPFNNGSIDDGSGNSNHLTNTTSAEPTTDRKGNNNCAFVFDNSTATEEFLTSTDPNYLNGLNEFSISLWYQPRNQSSFNGSLQGLFSRGNENQCPNRMGEWSMALYDCARAVFGHNNSVWAKAVTNFDNGCVGEVEALIDKWHHVVGIKSGPEFKIYFNGTLDDMATGDANCGTNGQSTQDLGDVFVGYKFTGRIDDIMIYNQALTESEVNDLFVLEACC